MIVILDKINFKEIKKEESKSKNEDLVITELAKILAKQFVEDTKNDKS